MIYYISKNGIEDISTHASSTKSIQSYLYVTEIKNVDKLAEYINFGFDIWMFIDSTIDDNPVLMHFTDEIQAKESYDRLT